MIQFWSCWVSYRLRHYRGEFVDHNPQMTCGCGREFGAELLIATHHHALIFGASTAKCKTLFFTLTNKRLDHRCSPLFGSDIDWEGNSQLSGHTPSAHPGRTKWGQRLLSCDFIAVAVNTALNSLNQISSCVWMTDNSETWKILL